MSLEKSKIFFSRNVPRDMGKLISDASGIQVTHDLGRYLGMPVLHKQINKETLSVVVERVSSRLSGWKGRLLSFAGRVTLTKAVLTSIPVHSMSSIKLSVSTLNKLEQILRRFLWEGTMDKKSQHLVVWEKVCRPKAEGGLGIRKASEMNKALIA